MGEALRDVLDDQPREAAAARLVLTSGTYSI